MYYISSLYIVAICKCLCRVQHSFFTVYSLCCTLDQSHQYWRNTQVHRGSECFKVLLDHNCIPCERINNRESKWILSIISNKRQGGPLAWLGQIFNLSRVSHELYLCLWLRSVSNWLFCLAYPCLKVWNTKWWSHNWVQPLGIISMHPMPSIMQKIDSVSHLSNEILILHFHTCC